MTLTRTKYYLLVLALCWTPFVLYKTIWIILSRPTIGKVVSMGYTGGRDVGRQTYANVQYHVGWETYTVSGDYNLPYSEGDDYPIRYSIFNNVSIRTNTFWGLWFDTMVWCVIGFVITTIAFLVDGIVPKDRLVKLTKWKLEFIEVRS